MHPTRLIDFDGSQVENKPIIFELPSIINLLLQSNQDLAIGNEGINMKKVVIHFCEACSIVYSETFHIIGTVSQYCKEKGLKNIDGDDFEDGDDYVIAKTLG